MEIASWESVSESTESFKKTFRDYCETQLEKSKTIRHLPNYIPNWHRHNRGELLDFKIALAKEMYEQIVNWCKICIDKLNNNEIEGLSAGGRQFERCKRFMASLLCDKLEHSFKLHEELKYFDPDEEETESREYAIAIYTQLKMEQIEIEKTKKLVKTKKY